MKTVGTVIIYLTTEPNPLANVHWDLKKCLVGLVLVLDAEMLTITSSTTAICLGFPEPSCGHVTGFTLAATAVAIGSCYNFE